MNPPSLRESTSHENATPAEGSRPTGRHRFEVVGRLPSAGYFRGKDQRLGLRGMPIRFLGGLAFLSIVASSFPGEGWTRFRGPNGTGVTSDKGIPSKWEEKDFNWKIDLPGSGHSSPVIWKDKLFVMSGDEQKGGVMLICLATRDGRIEWRKDFPFPLFPHHDYNSFGSSTPAVDGERVYICWTVPGRYTLAAFSHAGEALWERDLGPFVSQHSGGTSPIIYRDKVILANDQDGPSFLIALESATGKTAWQIPRKTKVTSYSTPSVLRGADNPDALIFTSQAHGFSAIAPDTGKVLWEYPDAFDKRTVSSPLLGAGLIFGSCGSGAGGHYVVALRPPRTPNGKPELAYTVKRSAPYVPTGIQTGNRLFLWSDSGIVSCLEAETGQVKWEERAGGNFFGSPVCVDGRLFCVSTTGEVVVIAAGDRFEVLARNALNDPSHSTPAVADGRIYVRTAHRLFSVGRPLKP